MADKISGKSKEELVQRAKHAEQAERYDDMAAAMKTITEDLKEGDLGMICSFGAGYSIGSLVVRKI